MAGILQGRPRWFKATAPKRFRGDGAEDRNPGPDGARHGARDLGPAYAPAVAHRGFLGPDAQPRGLHLHLDRPSEGAIAHAEPAEGVPPDRPKWSKVRVADAVERVDEPRREPVPE